MPNETPKALNEKLVREHLRHVTGNETAWVLVQEPGFIGFGVVRQDKIFWPPNMPLNWDPDWARVSDLRLFGKKGEWHVWRDWDGKHHCRLLEFGENGEWRIWLGWEKKQQSCPEKQGEKTDTLTEYHALWGKEVKCGKSSWIRLVEDRGVEIWLPLADERLNPKTDLPLRLKLKQVVGYDDKHKESSHLAGIVDAALVALVNRSCKKLEPPSFPPCTESVEVTPDSSSPEASDTRPDS